MRDRYEAISDEVSRPLMRWSAVFGGLVLGLALLFLLSALWLALAYGSHVSAVADRIQWYIGLSAVASLFVAGIITGYLSGVRGAGIGVLHGAALWGLLVVVSVTVGIPSVLNVFGLRQIADRAIGGPLVNGQGTMWAAFWTIAAGFLGAGLGGAIGGLLTRPAARSVVEVSATPDARSTTTTRVPPSEPGDEDVTVRRAV